MKSRKFQVAFKVVEHYRGETVSAVACGTGTVKYEMDKVAEPNVGSNPFLFVFKRLQDARRFAQRYHSMHIFKGIAIEPMNEAESVAGDKLRAVDYPTGTIFCRKFLPIQEVPKDTITSLKSLK